MYLDFSTMSAIVIALLLSVLGLVYSFAVIFQLNKELHSLYSQLEKQ